MKATKMYLKFVLSIVMGITFITVLSCGGSSDNKQNDEQRIKDSLELVSQQNEADLSEHMNAGDDFFEAEDFEAAIECYEKALAFADDEMIANIEAKMLMCEDAIEYANSPEAKVEKLLLGTRIFGVQFIWDRYGTAVVKKENEELKISGSQYSNDRSEYCKLDGTIKIIDERRIQINGHLQLYTHDCCGLIDEQATFNFLKSGDRKYWRWQDYDNYCSKFKCAYYLDIFE